MPPDQAGSTEWAVSAHGLTKTYPGVVALKPTDLGIRPASVHALVGENGAGKSTLLKILAGAQVPTAGRIELNGQEVRLAGPRDAHRHGVMAVYQELTVLPNLTALDNVFLGQYIRKRGLPDVARMRDVFATLTKRMGVTIQSGVKAALLSVADQQVLEIMRALHANARVLLLDEPTASLAIHERLALGETIRGLARDGVTVIWISHDLDEVLNISDDVSVFREGTFVESRPVSDWSKEQLVRAMLGDRSQVVSLSRVKPDGDISITLSDVNLPGLLHNVTIALRQGEIVGVAGLMGSGRSELLRSVAGLEASATGRLTIDEAESELPRSPRRASRLGIALAPEDRKTQGLVLNMATDENISMPAWKGLRQFGVLRHRSKRRYAAAVAPKVGLPSNYLARKVGSLSGGNQQKAVLAKWASRDLRLLLVDEPTRGIDINAKGEIYLLLDDLSRHGSSILLVSSEFDELVEVCDRVVVLVAGRVVDEISREHLSEELILQTIFKVAS